MFQMNILAGNLGEDAKVVPITNAERPSTLFIVRMATDTWNGKDVQTEWHSVKYFCPYEKYALRLQQQLLKGAVILTFGERRTDEWVDGEGNPQRAQFLYADDIKVIVPGKARSEHDEQDPRQHGSSPSHHMSSSLPTPAPQQQPQPPQHPPAPHPPASAAAQQPARRPAPPVPSAPPPAQPLFGGLEDF